jgi:hypothetical protein
MGTTARVAVDGAENISIQTMRDGGPAVNLTWDDRSCQIVRMFGDVN